MRTGTGRGAALAAALLAGAAPAFAQLATPSWLPDIADVSGSYSRISNFVDGRILHDPKSPLRHAQGEPLGLGRTRWGAGIATRYAPSWLEPEIFLDTQARIWGEPGSLTALAAAGAQGRGETIAPGTYPFLAHSQSMRRFGLSLRGKEPLGSIAGARIDWNAQLFLVDRFRHVDAQGVITSNTAGDVGLVAAVGDDKLGARADYVRPGYVLGIGISGGLAATWGDAAATHLRVGVDDLGPPVHLAHVLRTDETANTNRVSFDERGYIHFAPLISGQYGSRPYSARQYARWEVDAAWALSPAVQVLGRVDSTFPVTDFAAGARWNSGGQGFTALVHAGGHIPASLELGWRSRQISFSWRGDALTPGKARVWALAGQYRF